VDVAYCRLSARLFRKLGNARIAGGHEREKPHLPVSANALRYRMLASAIADKKESFCIDHRRRFVGSIYNILRKNARSSGG
jgi:hypothetical protein